MKQTIKLNKEINDLNKKIIDLENKNDVLETRCNRSSNSYLEYQKKYIILRKIASASKFLIFRLTEGNKEEAESAVASLLVSLKKYEQDFEQL